MPHPVLFGAITAVAAMIPFGAPLAFGLAAVLLLAGGAVVPAAIVVAAGFVVTFFADHFVRPVLIGGTTRLPFLWVLLGILGGVETFACSAVRRPGGDGRADPAVARLYRKPGGAARAQCLSGRPSFRARIRCGLVWGSAWSATAR